MCIIFGNTVKTSFSVWSYKDTRGKDFKGSRVSENQTRATQIWRLPVNQNCCVVVSSIVPVEGTVWLQS